MRSATGMCAFFGGVFFLLGVGNLIACSDKVRFHDLVRISTGGFQVGAATVALIGSYLFSIGRLQVRDKKMEEAKAPLPEKNLANLVNTPKGPEDPR
jgi:hypothetical protein